MEEKALVYNAKIDVRFAETDAMSIVHHATYPIWFEQARTEFFKTAGASFLEMEQEGFESPVLELNVQYKQPCRYGDTVRVETIMVQEDRIKSRFYYKVFVGDKLCTTGSTTHIFTKNGRPTRDRPTNFQKIADVMFSEKPENL